MFGVRVALYFVAVVVGFLFFVFAALRFEWEGFIVENVSV